MKAIVYTRYGSPDVLKFQEIEKPVPGDDEVLVKVHAASVNAIDWRPFTMPLFTVRLMRGGWSEPKEKSVGVDFAGRVEAVGSNVKQFQPGDEVFGLRRGSFAEYVCAPLERVAPKPVNLTYEEAAAVPLGALTALHALREIGKIQSGQKVLIDGAGGGVGAFAVQIAKSFGTEVTAVCSTKNQEVARSIGADHVIDYTREDVTKNGQRYDLIVVVNGYHPILHYMRALSPAGTWVVAGGSLWNIVHGALTGPLFFRWFSKKKLTGVMAKPSQKDLMFLKELVEAGKVKPVIDRRYPLAEAAEGIRYLIKGHSQGKVVIQCGQ